MIKNVIIEGLGVITPVGLNARQTAASVNAGISRITETSLYDNKYEPIIMSILPDDVLPEIHIEIDVKPAISPRYKRMLRLAAPALTEALDGIEENENIPIFIGIPEPLYDHKLSNQDTFIEDLTKQTGIKVDIAASRIFEDGRAGGIVAVKEAVKAVASGKFKYAIAGAVDTYVAPYLLSSLTMDDRIMGSGILDGFIPGEGAGFILIGSENKDKHKYAKILSVETGFEKGHLYSDATYRGEALSDIFQSMFSIYDASHKKIQTLYAGFNGENYNTKEWGIAKMRNEAFFDEDLSVEHPADCIGDTGSSLGIILTAIAAINLNEKNINGPALIWCSSDLGTRGAMIIDKI